MFKNTTAKGFALLEFLIGAMLFLPMAFALTRQAMQLANQQCIQFVNHTQALQKIRNLPPEFAPALRCPNHPHFIRKAETKVYWNAPRSPYLER